MARAFNGWEEEGCPDGRSRQGSTAPLTRPSIRLCPEHGVRAVRLQWAEPHGRFTLLFERLVIDWMKAASQQAVAQRLELTWDEIHGIMQRAVERGLKRREAEEISYIGVDEKAFRKGHRYATLVTDLVRSRVLYVAEE